MNAMRDKTQQSAIVVDNVSKTYAVWSSPSARLGAALLAPLGGKAWSPGWLRSRLKERHARSCCHYDALKDVSITVQRGETVGIVGANGAGKSTLLKIIVGTINPTEGQVTTHGNINALLELATGFNADFSCRENVFLNGALLGLSEAEVRDHFEEIAEFADIGEFIEQPIKTYSSGMVMRLAFACSTALTPDILIVDEALGVGDTPFQAKCLARMRRLVDQGTTILFTSHSTAAVRNFCSKALYLDHGCALMWGDVKDVCNAYDKACWKKMGYLAPAQEASAEKCPVEQVCLNAADEVSASEFAPIVEAARADFMKNSQDSSSGTGDIQVANF